MIASPAADNRKPLQLQSSADPLRYRLYHPRTGRRKVRIIRCPLFRGKVSKRFLIETVLDTLKSEMGLEHSRHRSVINAMVHILSCLVAYAFRPGKPSISLTSQRLKAYP
jgi:Transposase DDE domain